MNDVTVFIKNGRIIVDFSNGVLHIDAINLASRIKRLPDVASTTISKSGNITVTLSSARNVASLQRQISDLANERAPEAPVTASAQQISLF
jgi:hypothetical protein